MPSHSATLLEATRDADQWQVRARLACGCEVKLTVPLDRVVQTVDGGQLLAGKYRCPNDHEVRR